MVEYAGGDGQHIAGFQGKGLVAEAVFAAAGEQVEDLFTIGMAMAGVGPSALDDAAAAELMAATRLHRRRRRVLVVASVGR